ncbi:uncharacterized protein LOC117322475 [Pecten maximus]|uniref:uncharacterized protein LOC117322475 n=1 Tax=Pecten maximus TaxID=6579 RepID=UPI001458BFA2|nr:uncharacterized protein LOC117322475 [Pecten maximus]
MLSTRLALVVLFSWPNMFSVVVNGHGYMLDPPGRSSMWRVGFNTPPNYDDNGLNCGHRSQPIAFNDVQCGLCGDPFEQNPRENEAGGKYASGIISKYYDMGQIITIKIVLTSNHEGFFEFRLCENNDVTQRITKQCLKHLLVNPETGETRYHITHLPQHFELSVKLPNNVTCSQCVLQWRYRTANTAHYTENNCELCGEQEEFYSCSDIAIISKLSVTTTEKTNTGEDTAYPTTTSTSNMPSSTDGDVTATNRPSPTDSDVTTASSPSPTDSFTSSTSPATTSTTTTTPPTTKKISGSGCVSISKNVEDNWCEQNCHHTPPFCPIFFCKCL